MKNGVFWDVTPCVSEELSASFIRVTRIGELGTTLAVTSNLHCILQRRCWVTLKSRFLQVPHGVASQKMALFKLNSDRLHYVLLIRHGLTLNLMC
jgi:hypothetical protein